MGLDYGYITYVSEYGTVPSPVRALGSVYTEEYLPTLTADGYIHVGWYTTSTFDEGTKINIGDSSLLSDITLYAKWERKQVLVSEIYLSGIADALRNTTGDTATMKPSEMQTSAEGIASEVESQTTQIASNADLIAQIKTALEGKAINISAPKWIDCSTLPTTYAGDIEETEIITIYLEITENCKAILFRSPSQSASVIRTNNEIWHTLYSSDTGTFKDIMFVETNTLSISIATDISDCQYMII